MPIENSRKEKSVRLVITTINLSREDKYSVEHLIRLGFYPSFSDFARIAIREKLKSDFNFFPNLIKMSKLEQEALKKGMMEELQHDFQ